MNLSKIASQVISTAKNVSTIRRLSRFLESSAVDVRSWYRSTAKAWLGAQAQQVGEIRLIVDSNKIGFGYQLLMAVWRIDNEPFQLPGHGFTMFVGTAVLRNRSSC